MPPEPVTGINDVKLTPCVIVLEGIASVAVGTLALTDKEKLVLATCAGEL